MTTSMIMINIDLPISEIDMSTTVTAPPVTETAPPNTEISTPSLRQISSPRHVRDRDSDWSGPSREGGDGFGTANYKGK